MIAEKTTKTAPIHWGIDTPAAVVNRFSVPRSIQADLLRWKAEQLPRIREKLSPLVSFAELEVLSQDYASILAYSRKPSTANLEQASHLAKVLEESGVYEIDNILLPPLAEKYALREGLSRLEFPDTKEGINILLASATIVDGAVNDGDLFPSLAELSESLGLAERYYYVLFLALIQRIAPNSTISTLQRITPPACIQLDKRLVLGDQRAALDYSSSLGLAWQIGAREREPLSLVKVPHNAASTFGNRTIQTEEGLASYADILQETEIRLPTKKGEEPIIVALREADLARFVSYLPYLAATHAKEEGADTNYYTFELSPTEFTALVTGNEKPNAEAVLKTRACKQFFSQHQVFVGTGLEVRGSGKSAKYVARNLYRYILRPEGTTAERGEDGRDLPGTSREVFSILKIFVDGCETISEGVKIKTRGGRKVGKRHNKFALFFPTAYRDFVSRNPDGRRTTFLSILSSCNNMREENLLKRMVEDREDRSKRKGRYIRQISSFFAEAKDLGLLADYSLRDGLYKWKIADTSK